MLSRGYFSSASNFFTFCATFICPLICNQPRMYAYSGDSEPVESDSSVSSVQISVTFGASAPVRLFGDTGGASWKIAGSSPALRCKIQFFVVLPLVTVKATRAFILPASSTAL